MEALARQDLSRVQVVVLYFHQMTISPKALAVFDQYVASGGGVLAIHSVTASFKQTLDFLNIIGGRFTGHGEVEAIEMLPIPGSPIFGDLPSFTVTDELYLHEQQPGIEPHFTAAHQGQRVPLVWTHCYGQGRVCYACPGHTASALRHPVYQQILRRGLKWASGI